MSKEERRSAQAQTKVRTRKASRALVVIIGLAAAAGWAALIAGIGR